MGGNTGRHRQWLAQGILRVDPAAGKNVDIRQEACLAVTAAQQHLEPARALAQQDQPRSIDRAHEGGRLGTGHSGNQGGVRSVEGRVAEALEIGSASAIARA